MLWRHQAQLVEGDLSLTPHRSYVTPFELGQAWLQHQVQGETLNPTLPRHRRQIRDSIEITLVEVWSRRWHTVDIERQLFEVKYRLGQEWHPANAEVVRQEDLTWVARFLIGHYHFGS